MRIEIEGHQAISEPITLEITGLTVVTGPSNTGKTSIVRALLALLENERGNKFISVGKTRDRVAISNNEQTVEWIKTQKSSEYVINGVSQPKAGRSTPTEEIAKLGFFAVKAQETDYRPQFLEQWEKPFIIGETSPVAAAELIAASKDGQTVAWAIKFGQKTQNEKTNEIQLREKKVTDLQRQLDNSVSYEAALRELRKAAETTDQTVQVLTDRVSQIRRLRQEMHSARQRFTATDRVARVTVPTAPDGQRLLILSELASRSGAAHNRLSASQRIKNEPIPVGITSEQQEKVQQGRQWQRTLRQTQQRLIQLKRGLKEIPEIPVRSYRYQTLRDLQIQYRRARDQYQRSQQEWDDTDREQHQTDQERDDILSQLGYCPTCGEVRTTIGV